MPDKTVGMIVVVKVLDLSNRGVDIVDDLEQTQLLFKNIAAVQYRMAYKLFPWPPITVAREIHKNDRHQLAFARLRQRQHFDQFVLSAIPARKKNKGVGLLNEHQLPRKKETKRHQLGVVLDKAIRLLDKGQTNIDSEAIIPTGPFMPGLHDSRSGTRDNHKPLFREPTAK